MEKIIFMNSLENRLQWDQPSIFKEDAADNFSHGVQAVCIIIKQQLEPGINGNE